MKLTHFIVKKFLLQIDDDDDDEFVLYRINTNHDENELAKICFTYLSYDDFDERDSINEKITFRRCENYSLRRYVINH